MVSTRFRILSLLAVVVLLGVYPSLAEEENSGQPILVDEFGKLGHCDFTSRLDNFFAELSHHPDHHGYIINYKSANELPGQKDENVREKYIQQHIVFRNFDPSRITFVQGGYSDDLRTQLYRVPPGAAAPEPSNTVAEPKIHEDKTFLYDKSDLGAYGSDDGMGGGTDLEEYVLESVKAREAAELAAIEAESEAEQEAAEPDSQTDKGEVASQEDPGTDEGPYVEEPLTPEELDAMRFEWIEVSIAKFLSSRKKASGVLIFYADDKRYDIEKLKAYVEQGRNRLAEKGGLKADRFRVEFGGYRASPEVEFWFVPAKGKPPVPKPEERKPEEPHHH